MTLKWIVETCLTHEEQKNLVIKLIIDSPRAAPNPDRAVADYVYDIIDNTVLYSEWQYLIKKLEEA